MLSIWQSFQVFESEFLLLLIKVYKTAQSDSEKVNM